jgi:SAM-dependent methyltransferase
MVGSTRIPRGVETTAAPPKFDLLRTRARIWLGLLQRKGSRFVTSYLRGLRGIEIGASAHNRYFLDAINVDRYADTDTIYKREERRLALRAAKVDVVAPGDALPFDDDAADFVFSSHVIEHIPDPIRALEEWVRVARRYVVVVVPHRDRTFDADRPLTTANELIERHLTRFTSEEDKHWSVWTCESFVELCERIGLGVLDYLDPDDKMGNGFAVVIDASATPHADVAPASGEQVQERARRHAPLALDTTPRT